MAHEISQEQADIHYLNEVEGRLGEIYNRIQDRIDDLNEQDLTRPSAYIVGTLDKADAYLDVGIQGLGKAAAMLNLVWEELHPPELGPEE